MPKPNIDFALRQAVILRANKCCEYCKSQDRYSPNGFTVDHIEPLHAGGLNDFFNLAYACFLCNRLKSNKLLTFDFLTEKWFPIFNPRTDGWNQHFAWNEDSTEIIGITPVGRVTVETLKLNREKLLEYRKSIFPLGTHPPV